MTTPQKAGDGKSKGKKKPKLERQASSIKCVCCMGARFVFFLF